MACRILWRQSGEWGIVYEYHFVCAGQITVVFTPSLLYGGTRRLFVRDRLSGRCLSVNLVCWLVVLGVWTGSEYWRRKQYFTRMEAVLAQVDQRFLLGELMPYSDRLEDRLYRELIRQSNRSVIEKIHAAETQKNDYRAYIESWVHEIKAPITSIALLCENHKNDITRSIIKENGKIENLVERTLYYARSDEVYKDYIIQETSLAEVAAEVVREQILFYPKWCTSGDRLPKARSYRQKMDCLYPEPNTAKQPEIQA